MTLNKWLKEANNFKKEKRNIILKKNEIIENKKIDPKKYFEYKKKLDNNQLKIINNLKGNLLVIAGAGAGKTTILTMSIANLIIEANVNEKEIMLMTFTKSAAKKMEEKLNEFLGKEITSIKSGTFHSIAYKFCKIYYKNKCIPLPPNDERKVIQNIRRDIINFRLEQKIGSDNPDKKENKEIRKKIEYLIPKEKILQIYFSQSINWNKEIEEIIDQEQYKNEESIEFIKKIYDLYEEIKKEKKMLSFDDMLIQWNEILETKQGIQLLNQYKYFFVDEYQDTNILQEDILLKINKLKPKIIMVVGDPNQSIYGFRAANIENILTFEKKFKAQRFDLPINYRSSQEIVITANQSIESNEKRIKNFEMKSNVNKPSSQPIFLGSFSNFDHIIKEIKKIKKEGIEYKNIAILISVFNQKEIKNQIDDFSINLTKEGIKHEIRGGTPFFEKKHIKNILSIFSFKEQPFTIIGYNDFINIGMKYIDGFGEVSGSKITKIFTKIQGEIQAFLTNRIVFDREIKNRVKYVRGRQQLVDFYKKIYNLKGTIGEQINQLLFSEEIDLFNEMMEKDKKKGKWSPIYYQKIKDDYLKLIKHTKSFASFKSLQEDMIFKEDFFEDNKEKLIISTIHQAKGLEWDVVFIICLNNKILPHLGDDIEEERRKFHVAITRARKELCFSSINTFLRSSFLKEIESSIKGV